METINILIIAISVLALLLFVFIVNFQYLKHLKKDIAIYWEEIDEFLRKRQDLIPNLIETIRQYIEFSETKNLIAARIKAAKEYFPGMEKIEYEHDLSGLINKAISLGKADAELNRDTNFLELKKEIEDIESVLEVKSKIYNEKVRAYNKNIDSILMRPVTSMGRFKRADIFEFEI